MNDIKNFIVVIYNNYLRSVVISNTKNFIQKVGRGANWLNQLNLELEWEWHGDQKKRLVSRIDLGLGTR